MFCLRTEIYTTVVLEASSILTESIQHSEPNPFSVFLYYYTIIDLLVRTVVMLISTSSFYSNTIGSDRLSIRYKPKLGSHSFVCLA